MKRHRTAVLTLALSVAYTALPATALGSTLLSGYGGPGGGAQAILGSTLVNGGSGGVPGTGGGLAAQSAGSEGRGTQTTAPGGHKRSGATIGGRSGSTPGSVKTSTNSSSSYTPLSDSPSAAALPVSDDSAVLGLSSKDLLVLGLAGGALFLTGALTRRLARTPI